jgi:hypothetical protein
MPYPKRLFAPTGGSVVVDDAAHERALGAGWLDNAPPESDAPDAAGDADASDGDATDAATAEAPKRKKK